MTKQVKTSINIQASRETIWNILTDFEKFAEWNPFVKSLTGDVKVGNRIEVNLQGMTFKPKVLAFEEKSEFKWIGHLWVKGLFDGEHWFYLTENEDGTTHFEHSETFNGILVPLFSKKLDTEIKAGFEEMNARLKERAEKQNV